MRNQVIRHLFELGLRFDELPQGMRGYCEPTELGMKVHVTTIIEGRRLHGGHLLSWEMLAESIGNPMTLALDEVLRDIEVAKFGQDAQVESENGGVPGA